VSTDLENLSPGDLLAHYMRRRGWSAARLAEIAGGVSASSVRAYTADRSTPRPTQALAVANALSQQDGRKMLEVWGYYDLADGFSEDWERAAAGHETKTFAASESALRGNRFEYAGEPLSSPGLALVRAVLEWVQSVEAVYRSRQLP
jgi:hypothetical protein